MLTPGPKHFSPSVEVFPEQVGPVALAVVLAEAAPRAQAGLPSWSPRACAPLTRRRHWRAMARCAGTHAALVSHQPVGADRENGLEGGGLGALWAQFSALQGGRVPREPTLMCL